MFKKIVSLIILATILLAGTGCKLINDRTKNGSTNSKDIAKEAPVESPSDHIFDINLERVKTDLTKKKLGNDPLNWELKPEEIIEAEFGGSNLAQGKMESLYHLLLKKSGTEDQYESGAYFNYDWVDNKWAFKGVKQVYIAKLDPGVTKLDKETRFKRISEYQSRPPEIPTPAVIPPVPTNTAGSETAQNDGQPITSPVNEEAPEATAESAE